MSEVFHKSCYTSRSSGYKYRTLSTNTGERKRRDTREENTFESKFKELRREITSRIDNEVSQTQSAREAIKEKFEKVDAKINSMLALQDTVLALRKDLHNAEDNLVKMVAKVERMEMATASDTNSMSRRSFKTPTTIMEDKDDISSIITHI